ncbi:MAG: SHOCT domain-containing protein [Colwellia sp.]|nr:SHOCT domain-containing protein [Colwellia sp.]
MLPKHDSSKAGAASEIEKLHELKEKGIITPKEFEKKKNFLL